MNMLPPINILEVYIFLNAIEDYCTKLDRYYLWD